MSEASHSESFGYFTEAETAVRERRFADALFTLEHGLRTSYHTSQPAESKTLIRCLVSFIGILKVTLEQTFGEEWQEQLRKGLLGQQVLDMCCSFCGQTKGNVANLISGPGLNICNECVDICVEIIADARSES